MWLLLFVAGTGYLARSWQKARKYKSGLWGLKHINTGLHISQSSSSCTPRRGRSRTASRRGRGRRSQSAKSRRFLSGSCEGRLARNPVRDRDGGILDSSVAKLFEDFVFHAQDEDTSGQVQTSSQAHSLHGYKCMEPYLSLSTLCMPDQWKEPSSCDVKEQHSEKKPIFEALHGCSSTVLDFLNDQLKKAASFSRNKIDCIKCMETSVTDLHIRRVDATPSCLQVPGKTRERPYATCASKVTNQMGRKWSLRPAGLGLSQSSSYNGALWKHSSEKEMGPLSQRHKNACDLHSCLLKGFLDPEYIDQPHRCHYLTDCRRGNNHKNCARLGMAVNRKRNQKFGSNKTTRQKIPGQQATGFGKSNNSSTNHLLGSNGSAFVALGMTIGVACLANGCKNQLEDLNTVVKKTSLMIQELKEQINSKNDDRTVAKLFNSEYNDAPNTVPVSCLHDGLNELEAELEAELQLMELNVHSPDQVESEWRQMQQGHRQPTEDNNVINIDIGICDAVPVRDEEWVYESDYAVPPLELERRLWEVLEQRHEDTICELQDELRTIHERVAAKEAEVQWWKDRVWWLMETCLGGGGTKNDDSSTQSFLAAAADE